MNEDDNLPEFAKIIEKLNEELFTERDKYENEIKSLQNTINSLRKKYEPTPSTEFLIKQCIRSVNHYNIARVIHSLNIDEFKCISLKKREWLYKVNDEFIPMEEEILIKKAIDQAYTVFKKEIERIEDIIGNYPEHDLYEPYMFYQYNFEDIHKSFNSPRIRSFILRELRELFYNP